MVVVFGVVVDVVVVVVVVVVVDVDVVVVVVVVVEVVVVVVVVVVIVVVFVAVAVDFVLLADCCIIFIISLFIVELSNADFIDSSISFLVLHVIPSTLNQLVR